ncbi:hypothetical protein GQX74_004587 [Glossina fuscipes]|nr:hypothetical protein GQX74_004587 [Glossina fuscipes]
MGNNSWIEEHPKGVMTTAGVLHRIVSLCVLSLPPLISKHYSTADYLECIPFDNVEASKTNTSKIVFAIYIIYNKNDKFITDLLLSAHLLSFIRSSTDNKNDEELFRKHLSA